MSESLIASGSVTAPGIGAAIATLAAPKKGYYRLHILSQVSNAAVADLGNLKLMRGGVLVPGASPIPCGANGQSAEFQMEEIYLDGTQNLAVCAIAAGTAAIEYNVSIEAVPVTG